MKFVDVGCFVLGEDAGADMGDWDGELRGDCVGCCCVVAGAHVDLDVLGAEGGEDGWCFGADGVCDCEDCEGGEVVVSGYLFFWV